jgi:hypothetical protein
MVMENLKSNRATKRVTAAYEGCLSDKSESGRVRVSLILIRSIDNE